MPEHVINEQSSFVDVDDASYNRRQVVDVPCAVADYFNMIPVGHTCSVVADDDNTEDVEEYEESGGYEDPHDLGSLSYRELQELAKEYDIPANQSTDELIEALEDIL